MNSNRFSMPQRMTCLGNPAGLVCPPIGQYSNYTHFLASTSKLTGHRTAKLFNALKRHRGRRVSRAASGLTRRAAGGLPARLAHEGGEALPAVGERLGQHPPVAHEHRVGEELAVQ